MATLSFLAFLVFAVLDWMAVSQDNRPLEYVAKPGALAALIVWASTGSGASPLLIAALCLGLLGDIYLMLPVDLFIAGLTAFLFGHVAYIADFDATFGWRLFWFVVFAGGTWPVLRRILAGVTDPPLRGGIVVYSTVIAFMAASAFGSGSIVAAIGGALFVASDSILSWEKFVKPLPNGRMAVIVTYHLAQLCLAAALR